MQLGLCCSTGQRSFALGLAGRLERNLGIGSLIVEADSEAPVWAVWEQASASDAVLLLLDADSAPGPGVNRRDWESLLVHAEVPPVAYLRFEPCQYPRLLERRPSFYAPQSRLDAERWVERWVNGLGLLPRDEAGLEAAPVADAREIPDDWWTRLVDQPGIGTGGPGDADAAQNFALQARPHFQGVFWIGCEQRATTAVLAEIEHWSRGATRLLFILVYAAMPVAEVLPQGGGHSYLVLHAEEPAVVEPANPLARWLGVCRASGFPATMMELLVGRQQYEDWKHEVKILDADRGVYRPLHRFATDSAARQHHLDVLEAAFRNWRLQPDRGRSLVAEAEAALRYGIAQRDPAVLSLCLELALCLIDQKRHREAVAWLRVLIEEAERDSNHAAARRARVELSWLLDDAGIVLLEPAVTGEQLAFDFQAPG